MQRERTRRSVVMIAAFNEEDRIHDTVVSAALIPGVVGVVVADDGSTDRTGILASRAGAFVVRNQENRGKGSALEQAAQTLGSLSPFGAIDQILLLDGDLGASAREGEVLLDTLIHDDVDLVIGILPSPPCKAGFGFVKSLARDGIAAFGGGFKAEAPLSGQRAMTMECMEAVRPFARGYDLEVAMTISALQNSLRVSEVPVTMSHRHTGRDLKGFLHRGRQFLQIYRFLSQYNRRYRSRDS